MAIPESPLGEQHIAQLVRRFYGRARADSLLQPVFESAVNDWESHFQMVEDFFSRMLLDTNRYRAHPYGVHTQLSLRPEHFDRWLSLFRETALEVLPGSAAEHAIKRVEHMAESFKAGLFTFEHSIQPVRGKPAV